jgi:hypothetical protein
MSHPELASILGSLDITPKVFQSINGLRNHYAQHVLEGCKKLDLDLANAQEFIEITGSRIGACYCFLLGEFYQRKAKRIQDEQSNAALLDYQADVLEYQAAARMTTWVDDYWAYVGDDVDRDSLNIPPDDADEF